MDDFTGRDHNQRQSIQLHLDDSNPLIERFVIYPYPDLNKLWIRALLSPFERYPNLEISVYGPDGEEVGNVFMVEQRDQNVSFTMHLRQPLPGQHYSATATLSYRAHPEQTDNTEEILLDRKEFAFDLVFVEPT